jgi:hypothetical protein
MRPTYDIFTESPGGQPVWIESVRDLYSDERGIMEIIVHADFQALRRHIDLAKQSCEPEMQL